MDNIYLFAAAGVVIVLLIIQYDITQRKKLKKVLKKTRNVEPLFMMQSAGQKLTTLKAAMAEFESKMSNYGLDMQAENVLNKITAKLEETMAAYNNGQVTLSEYYDMLSKLHDALLNQSKKVLQPVISR